MAFLIRRQFARARALTQAELGRHAPTGIASFRDERYGDGPDAVLDVYVPETAQLVFQEGEKIRARRHIILRPAAPRDPDAR